MLPTSKDGPELKPEIEARIGRLFRWHLDPAPRGLWIDRLDEEGRPQAGQLSADTFCRLVSVLARYLGAAPIRHG